MKTPTEPPPWLTDLLRDDAALDDDGFTARVMAALPPRRALRARPAWAYALPPLFAAAGCAACWLVATAGHAPSPAMWTGPFALLAMVVVGSVAFAND